MEKRIAILFYGQPRFLQESINSIKEEFSIPGYTTDYFFHFWDVVAYKSTDEEKAVDQQNILQAVKPVRYSFTDYTQLDIVTKEIYDDVIKSKELIKDNNLIKPQNIFSINDPTNLKYYLGQFISLQNVTNLLEKYTKENNIKYDVVFRVRTDLFFTEKLWYEHLKKPASQHPGKEETIYNKSEGEKTPAKLNDYQYDKFLTYIKPVQRYKDGLFVNKGDLGLWEKFIKIQDNKIDNTKISFTGEFKTAVSGIEFENSGNEIICMRRDGRKEMTFFNTEYVYNYVDFHVKDWLLWGTQEAIINIHKELINAVKYHIKRSLQRINLHERDNNWGSGEIITGLAAFLSKTNLYDVQLNISRINALQMRRFFKIINNLSKENMHGLENITVKQDTIENMKKACLYKYIKQIQKDRGNEHQ